MPKKPSIKTQKFRAIKEMTLEGYSSKRINRILKEIYGSGIRRTRLLQEMRAIKEDRKKIDREKYIPKKYRKYKKAGFGEIGKIYRGSLIISSVPLHSKPFDRHYLGFRLTIFGYSRNDVKSAMNAMKDKFLDMVATKLKSENYAKEQTLGTENPRLITATNTDSLNGKWFYAIEEKGKDIDSKDGYY